LKIGFELIGWLFLGWFILVNFKPFS